MIVRVRLPNGQLVRITLKDDDDVFIGDLLSIVNNQFEFYFLNELEFDFLTCLDGRAIEAS